MINIWYFWGRTFLCDANVCDIWDMHSETTFIYFLYLISYLNLIVNIRFLKVNESDRLAIIKEFISYSKKNF